MTDTALQALGPMAESLLIPPYVRALESQRPDALLKDENAVALVRRMDYDFARLSQAGIGEEVRLALVLRSREFDRLTRGFLARQSEPVVVQIGCGLDARFERVDDGRVEWYDLDLPEVVALRRGYLGGERERCHLLGCSALDHAWMEAVRQHHPLLVLAEGVFMFFEADQVRKLVLALRARFPGAELVFDAFSPFFVWANNRRVARSGIGARCCWGLRGGRDLEGWGAGIRLLEEWFPFRCTGPRMERLRWVRHIPLLARATGVFHYRLGGQGEKGL